ncbi:hypothetical protein HUF18_16510 [Thalassolituus sp. ST750PaO-4]|uniref:hypothetical protein n=1 Tax=Thalassolituus sp. ST750PaO-4 TaxID=2742965 RepID=UPI002101FB55|nr:hypothetical protein [Thalassolituus sp. ST750PaO-4]MCA6061386.1 hypothetical protein [Thalassolituus sp. ST750PaO-4]
MTNCMELSDIKFRGLLSSVVSVVDNDKFISRNIYHYCNKCYLVLGGATSDGDYFIRSYLWTSSDSAAMRAIHQDCSDCYPGFIGDLDSIFPGVVSSTYTGLIDYFKRNLNEHVLESASYRVDDGIFIHKKIETKKYVLFFLSLIWWRPIIRTLCCLNFVSELLFCFSLIANLIMAINKGATYAAGSAVIVRCGFYCDLLLAGFGYDGTPSER